MQAINRHLSNILLPLLVAGVLVLGYTLYDISFYRHHHLSGWLLFYLILAQMFYAAQKRSERIRELMKLQWLSLHAEMGLVAVLILLVHIGWTLPDGSLGAMLIGSFVGVSVTGFIGLRIKRRYKAALALRNGREIAFEDISGQLEELHCNADKLVLECAARYPDSLLVDYYRDELSGKLSAPGNPIAQLTGKNQAWLEHFASIERIIPYLEPAETQQARDLISLLRQKNNLDYHYAHQGALKVWLLIHVPFAIALLLLTVLHIILVYAFSGGA